jgi:hypothetical protein
MAMVSHELAFVKTACRWRWPHCSTSRACSSRRRPAPSARRAWLAWRTASVRAPCRRSWKRRSSRPAPRRVPRGTRQVSTYSPETIAKRPEMTPCNLDQQVAQALEITREPAKNSGVRGLGKVGLIPTRGRRFKSCQPDRETASGLRKRRSEAVRHLNPNGLFPTCSPRIRAHRRIWGGQLVQDVCHVPGDRRLGDVELTRDGEGGVAELLISGLGVDPLRDERGR